jgi:DNA-binding MarR family transcriptional regulator
MQLYGAPAAAGDDTQVLRLHRAVAELVRRYQFRDRNEICCFGISVSQCYALEALGEHGELKMGDLAARMRLSVSTMTRVVDQLVEHGLVRRARSGDDRRVCCVAPTTAGRALLAKISSELLESERAILEKVPAGHRNSVISGLEELSRAIDEWRAVKTAQRGCCDVE